MSSTSQTSLSNELRGKESSEDLEDFGEKIGIIWNGNKETRSEGESRKK